jgi:hypothetical protein
MLSAPGYLARSKRAQMVSSSWYNLQIHLTSSAIFIFLVFSKPKLPMALGLHTVGQLTKWYLRFGPDPSQ